MPKQYKRKRLKEEQTQDRKPKNMGNYFNKSDRRSGKAISKKEKDSHQKYNFKELRFNIEMELALKCHEKEEIANKLVITHKCECPDPFSWTEEEVLKYHGLI